MGERFRAIVRIMRLTYLGQQNKKRVPRFGIRMVSNDDKAWVLAKMDVDNNWINDNDEPLDVSLTPTMLSVLARLSALETSARGRIAAVASWTQCCNIDTTAVELYFEGPRG